MGDLMTLMIVSGFLTAFGSAFLCTWLAGEKNRSAGWWFLIGLLYKKRLFLEAFAKSGIIGTRLVRVVPHGKG